jgi:hypothetical protein
MMTHHLVRLPEIFFTQLLEQINDLQPAALAAVHLLAYQSSSKKKYIIFDGMTLTPTPPCCK